MTKSEKDKEQPFQEILDLGASLISVTGNSSNDAIGSRLLLASSLFTTNNPKTPRDYFQDQVIFTITGQGKIEYRGEELRYNDREVWDAIIELARNSKAHENNFTIKTTIHSVLKSMGWTSGGKDYVNFETCLKRLKANSITAISLSGKSIKAVSLISRFVIKEASELEVVLDPEIYKLFAKPEIAFLNSIAVKNLPALARKIYESIVAGVKENLTVEEYLKLSGNNYKHVRQFKPKLISSLKQLKAGGYIKDFDIDKAYVVTISR